MNGPLATLTKGKERIKLAFGKGKSAVVDPAADLARKKEGFLSSHALAGKRVELLRKTPGADRNTRVVDLVTAVGKLSTDIREAGQKAGTPALLDDASKRITEIYTKANEAATACTGPGNLPEFEKAREKAQATLGEMRNLPGATTFPFLVATITSADEFIRKATDTARNAVTKDEVKAQITALKGVSKMRDDAKRGAENYLKSAPKNIEEFEKKRRAASDRIAEVRSLRGTTDDEFTSDRLAAAEKVLADLTTKARKAVRGEEAEVEAQIKRLAGVEVLAKEVEAGARAAKEQAKADVKALPKFNELLARAQKDRDALLEVPIARDEYKEATNLIAKSQLMLAKQGADEAFKLLSDYPDIIKRAQAKQKEWKDKVPPPAVLAGVKALSPLLTRLETLGPGYVAKMHADETERLTFLGHSKPADAVSGLATLLTTVQAEITTLEGQKLDAETKLRSFDADQAQLVKDGYKEAFFNVPVQLAKLASSVDFPARDWGRAVERLDNALAGIGEVRTAQAQSKIDWEKGAAERTAMRKLAVKLLDWPPLASRANTLLEGLKELEDEFQSTGDYAACQDQYVKADLVEDGKALQDALAEEKANGMPDEDQLAAFRQDLARAVDVFDAEWRTTGTSLKMLEGFLKDMADPTTTALHEEFQAIQDGWNATLTHPPGGVQPAKLVEPFVKRLQAVNLEAARLLKDPKEIDAFQKMSKAADAKRADGRLPAVLTGMLDQLERSKINLSAQRKKLADLILPSTPDDERAEGLLKLQDELKIWIDADKRIETERKAKTKQAVGLVVTGPLKRIKGRHTEFQDYQKGLEAEADDVVAMTDSDDPYFLKMARQETLGLARKVAAVDPQQRGDDGARYKAVEGRWSTLSKGLAGDLKETLPILHAELRKELTGLIGASRKASPEDAYKMFDDIEVRIRAANDRAALAKAENAKVKQRRERVEKQWAQVKKDTRTRVTDRVTEFAKTLETRLGEVDGALKEQNGFRRANAILRALEDQLRKVEVSDDPRAELQKFDAAAAQEQRAIRDLARTFEEELKYFKETTIPRARKLMQVRAAANKTTAQKAGDTLKGAATAVVNKLTKTRVGDTDLDVDLLESLEATVKNASKPVQSYLNMVSTTTVGAAKSPQLSTAKAAFESARGMLASAQRTVDALGTVSGGASLSVTQDLSKVEANWRAKTAHYSEAMQQMAGAIRKAATEETDPTVKAAAEKAVKTVTDASSAFHANAFAPEIAVLEKKDADQKAKLAAREKALTTMRAYRKLLLEHPVHKQLADSKNPFAEGSSMRAAARSVLIALKRIELETLVGV